MALKVNIKAGWLKNRLELLKKVNNVVFKLLILKHVNTCLAKVPSYNMIDHDPSLIIQGWPYLVFEGIPAQSAWATEYTDCISEEEWDSLKVCPDMTLNNLMFRLQ